MADLLLMLGAGLLILSVIAGIIALLQTRAPRLAAIFFAAGVLSLAIAAWQDPGSVSMARLCDLWTQFFGSSTDTPPA